MGRKRRGKENGSIDEEGEDKEVAIGFGNCKCWGMYGSGSSVGE